MLIVQSIYQTWNLKLNYFIVIILVSINCFAQRTIQYHPNSPATIGAGYDPKSPEQIYAITCIESEGSINIDTKNGVVDGSIVIKEIRDRKELFQAMGASLAIEASYGLYSGSTSISNNVSIAFESSSLIWTASISVNYGRWRLKNPHASQTLLDAPNPQDVLRICGNEIFTQEVRGAVATVIFEMRGLKSSERKELSQALTFSASGTGSADQKYKNVVNKFQETSQLNVYVNVQGGPGPSALSPIIENPSSLSLIRKTLKEYIKKTNLGNAKPLSFQTSPISQFKKIELTQAPDLDQDRLVEIYEQYMNLTALIRRIDELIKPTGQKDQVLVTFVSEKKREELQSIRITYENARTNLRNAGVACLKSGSGCQMPQIASLPRIDWPDIPEIPKVIGLRKCKTFFLYEGDHQFKKGDMVAWIDFDLSLTGNQSLFKKVALITNDSEIPLTVETKEEEADRISKQDPELKKFISKLKIPNEECIVRDLDVNQTFARVQNISMKVYHETPLGKIEVTDIFGRKYLYDLDNFQ